jgi:16S rRNA (cytosine967-C5)-methyltransferase
LQAAGVPDEALQAGKLVTEAGHLRLWPHLHRTDGFFAAVWQKKD